MVSIRCKNLVSSELKKLGVIMPIIHQGMVEFREGLSGKQKIQFEKRILQLGFEVLDDTNSKLLDRISEAITELVYKKPEILRTSYTDYLIEKFAFDYSEVTHLYSEVHGINLQQFILMQQVERMKEMLLYEDLNVKEIAEILYFKDGAQVTRVFKQATDLTPMYFKKMKKTRLQIQKGNSSEQ